MHTYTHTYIQSNNRGCTTGAETYDEIAFGCRGIYMCLCIHACMYIFMNINARMCVRENVYIYIYIYIYRTVLCMHACMYIFMDINARMCVCVCIYIYIYIYIYI